MDHVIRLAYLNFSLSCGSVVFGNWIYPSFKLCFMPIRMFLLLHMEGSGNNDFLHLLRLPSSRTCLASLFSDDGMARTTFVLAFQELLYLEVWCACSRNSDAITLSTPSVFIQMHSDGVSQTIRRKPARRPAPAQAH